MVINPCEMSDAVLTAEDMAMDQTGWTCSGALSFGRVFRKEHRYSEKQKGPGPHPQEKTV